MTLFTNVVQQKSQALLFLNNIKTKHNTVNFAYLKTFLINHILLILGSKASFKVTHIKAKNDYLIEVPTIGLKCQQSGWTVPNCTRILPGDFLPDSVNLWWHVVPVVKLSLEPQRLNQFHDGVNHILVQVSRFWKEVPDELMFLGVSVEVSVLDLQKGTTWVGPDASHPFQVLKHLECKMFLTSQTLFLCIFCEVRCAKFNFYTDVNNHRHSQIFYVSFEDFAISRVFVSFIQFIFLKRCPLWI